MCCITPWVEVECGAEKINQKPTTLNIKREII